MLTLLVPLRFSFTPNVSSTSSSRPRSNDATDDLLRFCERRFVMDACVRFRVAGGVSKGPHSGWSLAQRSVRSRMFFKNDRQTTRVKLTVQTY